jgi:hypothetical protein
MKSPGGAGFAMVVGMPDNSVDPSGNTEAFRAFTENAAQPATASRTPLIVGAAVVAIVLLAVIIWLVA